jgi:hypothetical protein
VLRGQKPRTSGFYILIEVDGSTRTNAASIAPHIARPIRRPALPSARFFALRNCPQLQNATLQTALRKMALCKSYTIFIYLQINHLHDLNGFV